MTPEWERRPGMQEALEIERVEAGGGSVPEQRGRIARHARLLEPLDPEVAAALRELLEREVAA